MNSLVEYKPLWDNHYRIGIPLIDYCEVNSSASESEHGDDIEDIELHTCVKEVVFNSGNSKLHEPIEIQERPYIHNEPIIQQHEKQSTDQQQIQTRLEQQFRIDINSEVQEHSILNFSTHHYEAGDVFSLLAGFALNW